MKREDLDDLQRLIEEEAFLQEAENQLDRVFTLLKVANEPELVKTTQGFWWAVYQARLRRFHELAARKEAILDC